MERRGARGFSSVAVSWGSSDLSLCDCWCNECSEQRYKA